MFQKDIELTRRVIATCIDLEPTIEDLGPGLRKGLWVRPEFDCYDSCYWNKPNCNRNSGGYHGCGARRLGFYVSVPGRGGVCFELYTPIYLPETIARNADSQYRLIDEWMPMGSVDYHISNPSADARKWLTKINSATEEDPCQVTATGDCWFDGTTLQAELGIEILLKGGTEGIWSWLAEQWLPEAVSMFGDDK